MLITHIYNFKLNSEMTSNLIRDGGKYVYAMFFDDDFCYELYHIHEDHPIAIPSTAKNKNPPREHKVECCLEYTSALPLSFGQVL